MKFRDYKIFRPNNYYHIFNRGNQKQDVFLEEQDFLNFLKRTKIALGQTVTNQLRITPLPPNSFTILAYCLMPNHYHFLIKQESTISVDRLIAKICTSYAMYFNKKYQKVGNLFQDAFKAKLIEDDSYLTYLSAYIHHNPKNLNYPFSSFLDYCSGRNGTLCNKNIILNMFQGDPKAYKKFVMDYNPKAEEKIQNLLFEE